MTGAATSGSMSPGLAKVAQRARDNPQGRLLALAHHLDVDALRRSYERLRKDAAIGVDGVSKDAYGEALEDNLRDLHGRLKSGRYRHQPLRRVHIPKDKGRTRPIGISATEDKIVQGAIKELLESVYELEFKDFSYGFRPGRGAHDALRCLNTAIHRGQAQWILEFDIEAYFDSIDRTLLKGLIEERIADKSLMRLIGKCLHVGILDGETYSEPEAGTAQGSILSPLLGNVYLHHVLDKWYVEEVAPRLRGRCAFVRYADDGVFGFVFREDAEWVLSALSERLAEFGLRMHPTKTRLVDFRRPRLTQKGGKGAATFDLLGFTFLWRRSRVGRWYVQNKTQRVKLWRARKALHEWCRDHRHWPVKDQHVALTRRIRGHAAYFGVRGNEVSLKLLVESVKRSWFRWLRRRSQRSGMNWERFNVLLRQFSLPAPKANTALWGTVA